MCKLYILTDVQIISKLLTKSLQSRVDADKRYNGVNDFAIFISIEAGKATFIFTHNTLNHFIINLLICLRCAIINILEFEPESHIVEGCNFDRVALSNM